MLEESVGVAPDPSASAATPIEGVREWRNPRNRVYVCEVHYRADPEKRSAEWKAQAQAGMPMAGWNREFEIDWETAEGAPVFPEYQRDMRQPFPVLPEARLLRFWDFGHVCPVCLFAQLDLHGRLRVLAELVIPYTALPLMIESVKAMTLELMGRPTSCFDCGDPAGESMTDLGAVRNELLKQGILLHTRPRTEGSYDALRARFLRRVVIDGVQSPGFLLHPRCPILHSALLSGFHLNPKTGKPVDKHPAKDVCDALRYGNDNLVAGTSDFMAKMRQVAVRDRAW